MDTDMANKQSPSGKKLMAKAVNMVYGFPGDLMVGWEARPIDADRYLVKRHNGTDRIMQIGDQVKVREPGGLAPSSAIVNRSDSGVLMVGNKSVIIGENIRHGCQARKLAGKNAYLLLSDKQRQLGQVTIGEKFAGESVTLVDGHLLKVGEDIYPITPKKSEITLLVMQSPYEGGYLSYINIIENGNGMNRKDGAMGALVPPRNQGEPAQFMEVFGGKMVVTARFWVENDGRKLSYQFRDGETALKEVKIEEEVTAARKLAIEAGIDPEDLAEYVEAVERLDAFKENWEKEGMALILGARYFQPHDPRAELEERGISYSV
jgi:hypothetical protein